MTAPLISVIIPCYNGADFLGDAIDSAVAQDYANLEIIVVDDGSTDNSSDIVATYPNVRYFNQRNAGVAAARNTGLEQSAGEFILFLDQDDRLLPGALQSSLDCLLQQPDCAFSFGDAEVIDGTGSPISEQDSAARGISRRSFSPHERHDHYLSLLRGSYIWTTGMVMHRRSALEAATGFDPSAGPAADTELHLRIARRYAICHNDRLVLQKRLHETNQTRNYAALLRSTITLLRNEKRRIPRKRRYRDALDNNMRSYENMFGKPLLRETIARISHGNLSRQTWRDTRVLMQYAPLLPARCLYQRFRQLLVNR